MPISLRLMDKSFLDRLPCRAGRLLGRRDRTAPEFARKDVRDLPKHPIKMTRIAEAHRDRHILDRPGPIPEQFLGPHDPFP